jgi:hypothetical protein
MKRSEIDRMVRCEGHEDNLDDTLTFQFDRAKHATQAAVLVVVDGEDMWIPYSHIIEWYEDSNEMLVTNWIASQKGLL